MAGRLKIDFHTAAGGERAEAGPVATVGGTRRGEERRRAPAAVVVATREEKARRRAEKARRRAEMGLVAAAAVAALGQRTRAPAARLGAAAEVDLYPSRPTRAAAGRHGAAAEAAPGRRAGLERRAARRAVPHPRP